MSDPERNPSPDPPHAISLYKREPPPPGSVHAVVGLVGLLAAVRLVFLPLVAAGVLGLTMAFLAASVAHRQTSVLPAAIGKIGLNIITRLIRVPFDAVWIVAIGAVIVLDVTHGNTGTPNRLLDLAGLMMVLGAVWSTAVLDREPAAPSHDTRRPLAAAAEVPPAQAPSQTDREALEARLDAIVDTIRTPPRPGIPEWHEQRQARYQAWLAEEVRRFHGEPEPQSSATGEAP